VYVPGVLVFGVTVPVAALMVKPAGAALYVPPAVPVLVTGAVKAVEQYGVPAYVIVALGVAVIVMLVVVVNTAQPPDAATV
jgi:hypothetical protein